MSKNRECSNCIEVTCTNEATTVLEGSNGEQFPVCDFHYTPDIGDWVEHE